MKPWKGGQRQQGRFTEEVKLMTSKEFERLPRAEQLQRFEKYKKEAASAGTLNR